MFTLRGRRTADLFGQRFQLGTKRQRLFDRFWAGVYRDHLLDGLPVSELACHFDERLGRPSKDLHIVVGVLVLQQLHDPSDTATVETPGFNLA